MVRFIFAVLMRCIVFESDPDGQQRFFAFEATFAMLGSRHQYTVFRRSYVQDNVSLENQEHDHGVPAFE